MFDRGGACLQSEWGVEGKRLMEATVDGCPTKTIITMNRLLLFFPTFDVNDIF